MILSSLGVHLRLQRSPLKLLKGYKLNLSLILICIVCFCSALTLVIKGGGLSTRKTSLTLPHSFVPVLSQKPWSKSLFVTVSFLLHVICLE